RVPEAQSHCWLLEILTHSRFLNDVGRVCVINIDEFHRLDYQENKADKENKGLESSPHNGFLYNTTVIS
ncbi:hypothetical protein AVEN_251822-1, partial [Araneus ventricosus]